MIFIDAHVHIYSCFDLEIFLDSALSNFRRAARLKGGTNLPVSFVLLLAEGKSQNWFEFLVSASKTEQLLSKQTQNWTIDPAEKDLSIVIQRKNSPRGKIIFVAGKQIVTAEKIEVLALISKSCISDGLSLAETIDAIIENGGIPVIAWGAGKWIGSRGRIVEDFISRYEGDDLFLGDNGGRPLLWPEPKQFRLAREKGALILPGSDPLPLSLEAKRTGSYGLFYEDFSIDMASPAQSIKELLTLGQQTPVTFGLRQNNRKFFMNQILLRLAAFRKGMR